MLISLKANKTPLLIDLRPPELLELRMTKTSVSGSWVILLVVLCR